MYRLNLPGKVVENGEETASYDVEKGRKPIIIAC